MFRQNFRSIASEQLDKINAELEKDVMIRAIHDVKGIDMGNSLVRYKVMAFANNIHNSICDLITHFSLR